MSSQSLTEFISSLYESKKRTVNNVQSSLYNDATDVVREFKERSPIDSGDFKHSWLLTRGNSGKDVIYSLLIQNNVPYSLILDEGVVGGSARWYWPSINNIGPTSNSGKLTIKDGRVWAGGRSPWGFVVGGISDKVLFHNSSRLMKMATNVADAFMGAL